jgi:hypothetical protein
MFQFGFLDHRKDLFPFIILIRIAILLNKYVLIFQWYDFINYRITGIEMMPFFC